MKRKIKILLLSLFFIGNFSTAGAEISLPAIIGSHMVLQQNSAVKIWGWCQPNEKVTLTTDWDTTTYRTTGLSNAKWSLQIKTLKAGGPYKITINGQNSVVMEDVMIGEVWVCSGQSNMEMRYSEKVKEYSADMESATNKSIRFFQIPRLTSEYPQDDTKGRWVVCNPEDARRFSLVGYFFGRQLQQALNVPVGLINSSWGGTPAEVWTPKDTIQTNSILNDAAHRLAPNNGWPVLPGLTYNAMIHPITNFSIAGAIWYQGEANVANASTYDLLLETMIRTWRKAWGKEFPFYFAQIAPFAGYGNSISSALLRESQTRVLSFPNTGMVVVHDLVDDVKDIHPKNKKDVGLRLGNYALAQTYGKKELVYKSPQYKNMQVVQDKVRINFDNAGKGLISKSGTPTDFYIAGDDKIFIPATAKIDGSSVVVWNKAIKKPVAVRFGFTNSAMPDLFSKEGLPVNLFRTDNWNDVNTIASK